jgi:AcrR family transcriptional regulator
MDEHIPMKSVSALEAGESGRAAQARRRRRQQILEAATEVFARLGYHEAGINDIIARAHIARGTFYLYFSSKRGVFTAILDGALLELRARVEPVDLSPRARPPREQLLDQVVAVLGYLLEHRDLTVLLLSPGLSPGDDVVERVQAFTDHVRELIGASLAHGIDLGLVRPCQTELVASSILGSVRGLIEYLLRLDRRPDLREVADELLQCVLSGVNKTVTD